MSEKKPIPFNYPLNARPISIGPQRIPLDVWTRNLTTAMRPR